MLQGSTWQQAVAAALSKEQVDKRQAPAADLEKKELEDELSRAQAKLSSAEEERSKVRLKQLHIVP